MYMQFDVFFFYILLFYSNSFEPSFYIEIGEKNIEEKVENTFYYYIRIQLQFDIMSTFKISQKKKPKSGENITFIILYT